MVKEGREHVGNLPVNGFPISAEDGGVWRRVRTDCFTCIDKHKTSKDNAGSGVNINAVRLKKYKPSITTNLSLNI